MVGDDAKRHVDALLVGVARRPGGGKGRAVAVAAEGFDLVKDRPEHVRLVVRDGALEIGEIFRALDDADHALETHACINMTSGQGAVRAVRFGVELDEHEVPDFDAARVARVDQRAAGVAGGREVDVDLRTRTARAGVTHHPEIIFLAAGYDVNHGVDLGADEMPHPKIRGFEIRHDGLVNALVRGQRHQSLMHRFDGGGEVFVPAAMPVFLTDVGAVDRRVQPTGRELPAINEKLPRPGDGLALEVVAETPVAEHLEKRVVVGVQTHVVEIVVLAARAHALLRVGGAGRVIGGLLRAEEIRHELVHARVGEKQVGRRRQQARRGHDRVLFVAEKIEKRLTNFGGSHGRGKIGRAGKDGNDREGPQITQIFAEHREKKMDHPWTAWRADTPSTSKASVRQSNCDSKIKYGNHSHRGSRPVVVGSAPHLGSQSQLGLRPERWAGHDPINRDYPVRAWVYSLTLGPRGPENKTALPNDFSLRSAGVFIA